MAPLLHAFPSSSKHAPMTSTPPLITLIDGYRDIDGFEDRNGNLRKQIAEGLSRPAGQKMLPSMLLYDERGLRLFDDATMHSSEYYLFSAEEEILKKHATDIVRAMHAPNGGHFQRHETVVELGAG